MPNNGHKDQYRLRLLVVDDEKSFADVLAKRLKKRHIHTTTAYSGSEGIRKLRESDFDVAVLDLKMSGMDGIELMKIFKKMVPHLPVIMLTGHGSEQASQEGLKLGVFDYLTKPYDLSSLIAKIEAAARVREANDE